MKHLLLMLLPVILSVSGIAQTVEKLDPAGFKRKSEEYAGKQLIDVRTPGEFSGGHIPGAQNINVYDKNFAQQVSGLSFDKSAPVFVYCKAGGRSAAAVKELKAMGFQLIYDLDGGLIAWENKGLPLSGKGKQDSVKFDMSDFKKLLSSDNLVVINFYAPWCAPCKEMAPVIDRLSNKYKSKVDVHRIDYDQAKDLCRQLSIDNVPTIVVFKSGKEIRRVSGFQSENELETLMRL